MPDAKVLVIIRGIPGSGKTTTAKEVVRLLGEEKAAFHEADKDILYNATEQEVKNSHEQCQGEVLTCDKQVVVVSNSLTKEAEVEEYVNLFKGKYPKAEVLVYLCAERFQNVNGVPEDVVEDILNSLERYPGEGYVDRRYSNPMDIVKTVIQTINNIRAREQA